MEYLQCSKRKQLPIWHYIFGENSFFLKNDFISWFYRQRGREGEWEGETHQWVATSHTPPTRDLTCNPGMWPEWELNQWPFGSQTSTQSIEPHQLGWKQLLKWEQSPDRCGSFAWVSSHRTKGGQFDSYWGTCLGGGFGPQLGCSWEATNWHFSPSFPPSLKMNK